MTRPLPTRTPDRLLLRSYERLNRTHPVLVFWATAYGCERYDAVVDDDSELGFRMGFA